MAASSPYPFTVDVFRTVCDRLAARAADLRLLAETGSPFDGWLTAEAFLACKERQASYPFCEVTAGPTYASDGVAEHGGDPSLDYGGLRVGGPDDGADHCWLFAEFVLAHDGDPTGKERVRKAEAAVARLKRLGWKKSAALLVVVTASTGDVPTAAEGWNGPALTDPFVLPLPGGGTVVVMAFDVKQNPADVLTAAAGPAQTGVSGGET